MTVQGPVRKPTKDEMSHGGSENEALCTGPLLSHQLKAPRNPLRGYNGQCFFFCGTGHTANDDFSGLP